MHWLRGKYIPHDKLKCVPTHVVRFTSSYKFHRLFPLSQYDLPSHNSKILSFTQALQPDPSGLMGRNLIDPSITPDRDQEMSTDSITDSSPAAKITQEQICQNNPGVDYTRCNGSKLRCIG